MALSISNAARSAAAAGIVGLIDGGPGPGTIQVRTGGKPATVATGATGTLLGTLTMSDPAFGAPANGVVTASAITGDTAADASGTAGWFRVLDSTGTAVIDGTVTATGGGGDMILSGTAIVAGGTINVTAFTITMPAG